MQRKIRSDVEVRDVAQRMTLRLLSLPVGDLAACPAVAAVRDALRRFAAMGGRAGGHEAGLAAVPELRCCIAWSLSTRRVARPRLDLLRLPPEDAEGKAAPREVDALLDRAAGQRAAQLTRETQPARQSVHGADKIRVAFAQLLQALQHQDLAAIKTLLAKYH